jgi:hypothetical protein
LPAHPPRLPGAAEPTQLVRSVPVARVVTPQPADVVAPVAWCSLADRRRGRSPVTRLPISTTASEPFPGCPVPAPSTGGSCPAPTPLSPREPGWSPSLPVTPPTVAHRWFLRSFEAVPRAPFGDDLEVSRRRHRRRDRPSWSWADPRSTIDSTYRAVRLPDPPSASRRPVGSSVEPPTSAGSHRPTRLAPAAFAPPSGLTRDRPLRDALAGHASQRASRGVPCPSAHAGFAGPLARGFQAPLRSAPRVSTLSAASSPRALPGLFHPGALLGFALQGFAPPGPP